MSEFVQSADGTRIAYDRVGTGPAVILVGGAMQFRAFDPSTVALSELLGAAGFTAINYDRRGRGESAEATGFSLRAEVEDIAALIAAEGGTAAVFGSSSGAAIALWAAAAEIGVNRLVLWEAPLPLEGNGDGGEHLAGLRERLASGDAEATVEFFMKDMPPEWLEAAKQGPGWPTMVAMAPSLLDDAEALAATQKHPWAQQWAGVTVPTLVIVGEETLPIFPPVAAALVAALPNARRRTIVAQNHGWEPRVMAEAVTEFLRE